MAFTHIDCFSGPGGICTGLHAAGFETTIAIEYIKSCVDTYSANHPEVHVIHADIRDVNAEQILPYIPNGKIDLVTSGMPCETFSTAGNTSRSFYDYRLKLNEASPTVTSHCLDEFVHPKYDRALTVRECARLQSFPDAYDFNGGPYIVPHIDRTVQDKYEQIDDAVPPLLAYVWGIKLNRHGTKYISLNARGKILKPLNWRHKERPLIKRLLSLYYIIRM